MKSHEIVQEYLRKYSLPDTSQSITNIFIKIFSQNFFQIFFPNIFFQIFLSKFSSKFFLRIFFPNFFFKIFCQNFPQNFFEICFEGFARETHACDERPTRETRVLRAPHAGFFS